MISTFGFHRSFHLFGIALLGTALLAGCNSGPKVYPVSGTVKFEDGSIPTGEVKAVEFYPIEHAANAQMATGTIGADGSFKLTTFTPEDGAQPGDYNVVFNIKDKYIDGQSLVAAEFSDVKLTTQKATVKSSGNKFDFIVKKRM